MTDSQKSNSTPTSPLGRVLKWYGTIAASILSIPVGIIGVVIDSTMLQAMGITLATMSSPSTNLQFGCTRIWGSLRKDGEPEISSVALMITLIQ